MSTCLYLIRNLGLKHWPVNERGPGAVIAPGSGDLKPRGFYEYASKIIERPMLAGIRIADLEDSERISVTVVSNRSNPAPKVFAGESGGGDGVACARWFKATAKTAATMVAEGFAEGADVVIVWRVKDVFPKLTIVAAATECLDQAFGVGAIYTQDGLTSQWLSGLPKTRKGV